MCMYIVTSEPCKNGWSDRDAVCVENSGGPKEPRITYSRALRAEYYIVGITHNTAIWSMYMLLHCLDTMLQKFL